MPFCGAMFDENSGPLGQGGTSGGFSTRQPTHPGAARHPSQGGDSQEGHRAHRWIRGLEPCRIHQRSADCSPPHSWPLSHVGERRTESSLHSFAPQRVSAICALVIKHKLLPSQYCPRKVFNRFALCAWIFTSRCSFQKLNSFAELRLGRIPAVGSQVERLHNYPVG